MITKFEMRSRGSKTRYDLRKAVSDVVLTTDIAYTASQLTFSIYQPLNSTFRVKNGDIVMFNWSNNKTFYGFVFKWNIDEKNKITVTAYDKLRYLKNSDSFVAKTSTLGQRFKTILSRAQLKGKVVNNSSQKLKAVVCDNKSYFDILKDAIEGLKKSGEQSFFIRDNYGTLELCKVPYKKLKIKLNDKNSVISYTLERSIDQNTANVVKVVSDNSTSSAKKTSTAKSKKKTNKKTSVDINSGGQDPKTTKITTRSAQGNSVQRWGQLVYVDKVVKKANSAQMKARAESLLKKKNKQQNTFKLKSIGNINFQAGNSVQVIIDDLKRVGINSPRMIITKATHNFGTNYTVDLEMRV